jgi:hypothetical protein
MQTLALLTSVSMENVITKILHAPVLTALIAMTKAIAQLTNVLPLRVFIRIWSVPIQTLALMISVKAAHV